MPRKRKKSRKGTVRVSKSGRRYRKSARSRTGWTLISAKKKRTKKRKRTTKRRRHVTKRRKHTKKRRSGAPKKHHWKDAHGKKHYGLVY